MYSVMYIIACEEHFKIFDQLHTSRASRESTDLSLHDPSTASMAAPQSSNEASSHSLPQSTTMPCSATALALTAASPSHPSAHSPLQLESTASSVGHGAPVGVPLSSREMISHNVQTLIEDINNKRKQDTQLITDYKKALEMQVGTNQAQLVTAVDEVI